MTARVPSTTYEQCFHTLSEAHPEADNESLGEAAALLADFVDDDTPPEMIRRRSLQVAQQLRELFEGGARTDSLSPSSEPKAPAAEYAPVTVDG